MKVVDLWECDSSEEIAFRQEVHILHQLRGEPNIIKMLNAAETERSLLIVLELGRDTLLDAMQRMHQKAQVIESKLGIQSHCWSMVSMET